MAISWGAWEYSGGNGMRVGLDVSWEAISTSEAVATCTVKCYTQNQYNYSDNQTLNISSNLGGDLNFNNGSGGGSVLRTTRTYNYTYGGSSYGSSPGNVTFTISISGAYNGVTPSKSVTTAIPARPYAAPNAPSSVNTVRNSDAQATTTWVRNNTAQRPYTVQPVQRRVYTGSSWGSWVTVINASATATSFLNTGLSSNRAYQYQVRANNSVGTSSFVAGPVIYMTPAAPSAVTAGVSSGGTTILVKWTNNHYVNSGINLEVQRSVNGGAFANVVTGLSYTTTQWTDPSPGAGTNQYRVRAVRSGLNSAYSTSNTVSTIVPSLAPTLLSPNGVSVDLNNDLTLTWQHNDGGDGAEQSHFTIRYSTDGGGSWTALATNIASTDSSYLIAGGTLPNGSTYTWQVQTQGSTTVAFGPYSSSATFTGVSAPTLTLDQPDQVINFGPIVAEWTYSQSEGHPQTGWEAELWDADGNLLEGLSGDDDAASSTFTQPVEDNKTYTVRVRVRSSDSLWSDWAELETLVDLLPPAIPHISGAYDECSGSVALNIWADPPVPGETVDIDHMQVQRSIHDDDWVTLAGDFDVSYGDISETYSEGFEVDEGGWAGDTVGGNYDLPTNVIRTTEYAAVGDASLEIEWAAGSLQFAGFKMTGLTIGQVYTYVGTAFVDGSGDVRLSVPGEAESATITTVGFGEGPFGTGGFGGFGGWSVVSVQFVATATEQWIGMLNYSPQDSTFAYLDHVVLYEGAASGYYGAQLFIALVDPIPSTTGRNSYRVIAYAENGSASISEVITVQGTDGMPGSGKWGFLSYGDGFSSTLRMRGDLAVSATSSRNRSAYHFTGRRLPTMLMGEQIDKSLDIDGIVRWRDDCPIEEACRYDSSRDEWEQAAWDAEVICWRDHTGRRVFGLLGDIKTSDILPNMASVGISIAQIDYTEQPGIEPQIEE